MGVINYEVLELVSTLYKHVASSLGDQRSIPTLLVDIVEEIGEPCPGELRMSRT